MARRNSGGSALPIVAVGVISAVSATYKWAQQNIAVVLAIIGGFVCVYMFSVINKRKKHAAWVQYLHEKYKNPDVVKGILNSEFWQGQTAEQLEDSLGAPAAIDRQVLKTKRKEVWKYREVRKGQFGLKVTLENHKVVGWENRAR